MLNTLTKRFTRPRHQQPNRRLVELKVLLPEHMLRDIGLMR